MKRKSFIITMTTCILCMCLANAVLCSCSDDDEGKEDVSLTILWNIDEEKTICLEDHIPNIGKDYEISGLDPEKARVEYVSSRNVHILLPVKYLGITKPVITTESGRKYYLKLYVFNDITWDLWEPDIYDYTGDYWQRFTEKSIVCNADIRKDIEADLKERNVFWNNTINSLGFNIHKCVFNYNGNGDGAKNGYNYHEREAYYDHDISTDEYTFFDSKDINCRQTMKVSLKEKSAMTGRDKYYKKADFEFDITKDMQDKYGADNVKKVSLVYHFRNIINL